MADTVFLVNPASDNGATGKRWPELAHRAAQLGLEGTTLFSEHPGHATRLLPLAQELLEPDAVQVAAQIEPAGHLAGLQPDPGRDDVLAGLASIGAPRCAPYSKIVTICCS